MEELFFIGIIILFSIAESIARRRKAKARQQSGEPAEVERFEWAQTPPWEVEHPAEHPAELQTYDADPSYDDEAVASDEKPVRGRGGESAADIWAEIAGLASGTKEKSGAAARPAPPPPERAPPREPDIPRAETQRAPRPSRVEEARTLQLAREESARRRVPTRVAASRLPARRPRTAPAAQHEVHLAHVGYGTDPSERAPSEQDGLDPLAEYIGVDAAAVQSQLRSKDPHALRQAIILQEVLSTPVSLRD